MELRKAFAKALQISRKSQGLTQEDFSDVSSRTYMSTLERGIKCPTIEKIDELASVMQLHPVTIVAYAYLLKTNEIDVTKLLENVESELERLIKNNNT